MSKIRKNYPAKFKKEVVLAVLRDDTRSGPHCLDH